MARPPVLTADQCMTIRRLYSDRNMGIFMLAVRYGVAHGTISKVINGQHTVIRELNLPNLARRRGGSHK